MAENTDPELEVLEFQPQSENPLVYECADGTRIYLTFFLQSIKRELNRSGKGERYNYEFEMAQNTQIISPKDTYRKPSTPKGRGA